MFDYQDYLHQKDALAFEEALVIYQKIEVGLAQQDDDLHELWQEVVSAAMAYTQMRTQWHFFTKAEKMAKDSSRTSLHNTFIISLTAFSRLSEQLTLDTSWLELLGPVEQRKKWGDFAGYLVCIEHLQAR